MQTWAATFDETFIRADGTREMEVRTSRDGRVQILTMYTDDGSYPRIEDVLLDGQVVSQTTFRQGVREKVTLFELDEARPTTETFFDTQGNALTSLYYSSTGDLRSTAIHNGRLTTVTTFDQTKPSKEELYFERRLIYVTYFDDGQPIIRRHYNVHGQVFLIKLWQYADGHKTHERWLRSDGSLKSEVRFDHLKRRTVHIRFAAGGVPQIAHKFVPDEKKIVEITFDQQGRKQREQSYLSGAAGWTANKVLSLPTRVSA